MTVILIFVHDVFSQLNRFLIYINDFLSSGYISDLFTKEEYDAIFTSLRNSAKADGIPDNRDSMMKYFIDRVKSNLHIILCFSPVGDTFRNRVRKFPAIINCTTMDWYHEWKKDALVSVALKFLESIDTLSSQSLTPSSQTVSMPNAPLNTPISDGNLKSPSFGNLSYLRESLAYHVAEVHMSVSQASIDYLNEEKRYNYTTPKSFLELIGFYKYLLIQKSFEMNNSIKRLENGLDTLIRTNQDVKSLQEYLKDKKKEGLITILHYLSLHSKAYVKQ